MKKIYNNRLLFWFVHDCLRFEMLFITNSVYWNTYMSLKSSTSNNNQTFCYTSVYCETIKISSIIIYYFKSQPSSFVKTLFNWHLFIYFVARVDFNTCKIYRGWILNRDAPYNKMLSQQFTCFSNQSWICVAGTRVIVHFLPAPVFQQAAALNLHYEM